MARSSRGDASTVVVIGIGRFGKSLALELMDEGVEVLGIDEDPRTVERLAGRLTHVVQADSTSGPRRSATPTRGSWASSGCSTSSGPSKTWGSGSPTS